MIKVQLAALLGGLAAFVACGSGASVPPDAESNAEEDGLRLMLELTEDEYVANEFGAATVALLNEGDSTVKVTNTSCSPEFDLWVTDEEGEVVFTWIDYWIETELGYGLHDCLEEVHTIRPGESLKREVGFVIPEAGEFRILADADMWKGESAAFGAPTIDLPVHAAVKVDAGT